LLLNGVVVGSIYALVGMGFVIIFKSTSVLNFAQGEFLLLGAYISLAITTSCKIPFFAAMLLTLAFAVLLGIAIERLILRPMIGKPVISIIMVTLGLRVFCGQSCKASGARTRGPSRRFFPPRR